MTHISTESIEARERVLDFMRVSASGFVGLARLEFGGLAPVAEGKRAAVLRLVRAAFAPSPEPARPT